MKPNPVGWFEIYVQDLARARYFYETVLGTTLSRLDAGGLEMWAFPMAEGGPGIGGALLSVPGVPSGGNSTLVYFSCEDCAVEASRAAAAGGKVQREKMSIGQYGHVAMVFDTEGNLFGLHSMK
jgi:predicted enzyme related to lactoylglutathione lyase